jgi:hypothetical protein
VVTSVDVVEPGDDLLEDGGDEAAGERPIPPGADELVEVALHGFEDKVELLGVWA